MPSNRLLMFNLQELSHLYGISRPSLDHVSHVEHVSLLPNLCFLAFLKLYMMLQEISINQASIYKHCLQEPHILRVVETSPHEQLSQASVDFLFPSALLPQAVLTSVKADNYLTVISAGGILYSVLLQGSHRARPEASVLHGQPKVLSLRLLVG